MAENEKTPEAEEASPAAKSKSKVLLFSGGGAVAVLAGAYVLSLMAIPDEPEQKAFAGPFVAPLTPQKVTVNLSEESNKRFVVMDLNATYDAYEEEYQMERAGDLLYNAELIDVLLSIATTKTRQDVLGKDAKPVFMEEVRAAVEPLLFPVHVGLGERPEYADPTSGLAPGLSIRESTFRGPFHEHVVHVNAVEGTLAIDGGTPVPYESDENFELVGPRDEVLFLDTTGVVEGFQGEVMVGVHGRLRRVLWNEVLVQ